MTLRLSLVLAATSLNLGACTVPAEEPAALKTGEPLRRDAPPEKNALPCVEPLVFGHRGTPLFAPENSLAAYAWALDHGADGLEIDVRQTADGVLVAMHDPTVGRTTDGGDVAVSSLTLAELRRLDAGAWFDPGFAGTRVPTLDEIFDAFAEAETLFLLDVKTADAIPALVAELEARSIASRSIFASHSLAILEGLHAAAPHVPAMYFMKSMDEIESLSLPSLHYLRVPKEVQHEPGPGLQIVAAGYELAASGRALSWETETAALTAIVLANNARASSARRQERRPAECEQLAPE
jgi:glycerophosphoryl diester phosphodiesterase